MSVPTTLRGSRRSKSRLETGAAARAWRVALAALIIGLGIAYLITIHVLIARENMRGWALVLALLPVTLMAMSVTARAGGPTGAVAAVALGTALGVAAWIGWPHLRENVNRIYFAEQISMHLFLFGLFAFSLLPPRDALVTRLARATRGGELPDSAVPYTRAVTLAWAVFFAVAATISALLFAFANIAAWSVFVNLLMWPLVAAMFVIEYAIRLRCLSDLDHVSIFESVRAFWGERVDPQVDRHPGDDAASATHEARGL